MHDDRKVQAPNPIFGMPLNAGGDECTLPRKVHGRPTPLDLLSLWAKGY